jgi:hypothetical protein
MSIPPRGLAAPDAVPRGVQPHPVTDDVIRRLPACIRLACAAPLIALAAAVCGATEPSLPITVTVRAGETYLRAGPGDDFYPTERLAAGDAVEVWAIDTNGYCAVRPVDGSFSWMRADDLADVADTGGIETLGVVATDGAVARVGSQLNDLRHVTQVALEAGERVRVRGRVQVEAGRHAGDWVRIDPPSGEFRWARGEDLQLPAPWTVVLDGGGGTAGLAAAGETVTAIREAQAALAETVAAFDQPPDAVDPAPDPVAPQVLEPEPLATRLFGGWLPTGTTLFAGSATPPPAVNGGAVAASADELADIDLALSLAVTGPTAAWNLAPIRERLRLVSTRTSSTQERMRAEALDARLSRFEEIQSRQRALVTNETAAEPSPLRLGAMWSSLSALGSRPIRPGVMPGGKPADGRPTWTPPDQVEVTGRLATVVSRRPDAPRWAIVDDRNAVLAFVTPQTGVNLAPLVGQQVAVRGAKGYMPEYQRPYLVASEARTRMAAAPAGVGPR